MLMERAGEAISDAPLAGPLYQVATEPHFQSPPCNLQDRLRFADGTPLTNKRSQLGHQLSQWHPQPLKGLHRSPGFANLRPRGRCCFVRE